jgi:hypothetical protein
MTVSTRKSGLGIKNPPSPPFGKGGLGGFESYMAVSAHSLVNILMTNFIEKMEEVG